MKVIEVRLPGWNFRTQNKVEEILRDNYWVYKAPIWYLQDENRGWMVYSRNGLN
jgi:hypothetical protein